MDSRIVVLDKDTTGPFVVLELHLPIPVFPLVTPGYFHSHPFLIFLLAFGGPYVMPSRVRVLPKELDVTLYFLVLPSAATSGWAGLAGSLLAKTTCLSHTCI